MDLVTLVTACALTVDPKLMHALVWHSSGGEPWVVSLPGELNPRVYPNMRGAIREARSNAAADIVRVGLAGVPMSASRVSASALLPCRNVAMAAEQIAKHASRCKADPRFKTDPMRCAVGAYRGSWRQPDVKFAAKVMVSYVNGDAPDFDMPADTSTTIFDLAADQPAESGPSIRDVTVDIAERVKSWSSALFPSKPALPANKSERETKAPAATIQPPSDDSSAASPSRPPAQDRGLFVPRSVHQPVQ